MALDGAKTTNRGLLPPRSAVADLLEVLARQETGQAAIHFLLFAAMLVENNSWVCPPSKSMTSHSVGYLPFSSLPFSPSARRVDLFGMLKELLIFKDSGRAQSIQILGGQSPDGLPKDQCHHGKTILFRPPPCNSLLSL